MAPWEILPHPSDLLVRVSARDRRELFAEAVRSTFQLCARPVGGWPSAIETREIAAGGDDEAAVLRRLLSDCLHEFESDGFLARDVEVEAIGPRECRVRLAGACFRPDQLEVAHVIKAVTWHGLAIRDERDRVCAEILHDL